MTVNSKVKILVTGLFVVFGVASRFLPHAWNFTPVTAIALFTAAYFGWRYSAVALFGLMFVSDIFLGFYHWPIMLSVYASFGFAVLVGYFLKNNRSVGTVALGTLSSSLVFFLVTNWAVWQFGTMYDHSWPGLIQSYVMALPFFKNSFAGDFFYTGLMFGSFELCLYLGRRYPLTLSKYLFD